jgi:hypothetical protein
MIDYPFASGAGFAAAEGAEAAPVAAAAAASATFLDPCPLKMRVGENSPNRCPTMFSETKTLINLLPLCTSKVWPTISGKIIERRDQVLIGFFLPLLFILNILSIK